MEPIQEVTPVVPELLTPAPVAEVVSAEVAVSAPAEIEVSVAPAAATVTLPAAIESSVVEIEAVEPHVYINGRDYGVDGLTLDYNKE